MFVYDFNTWQVSKNLSGIYLNQKMVLCFDKVIFHPTKLWREVYRYYNAFDYARENSMLDILIIEPWYGKRN